MMAISNVNNEQKLNGVKLQSPKDKTPQHEINKTAVIGVVGFSVLLFMAWR